MNQISLKSMAAICLLAVAGMTSSCEKKLEAPTEEQPKVSYKPSPTMGSGDWIYFTSTSNKEYTKALAEENFGTMVNNVGFDEPSPRAYIENQVLKIKMLANSVSQGGVIGDFDITDGPSYEVSYKVKFPTGFDFGAADKGGKLGFGFAIGDGNTGGVKSNGNGGSIRMMWVKLSSGKAVFKPYIYHTNMPDNYGDDLGFDNGYSPGGLGIQTETYYTIKVRVKSNDNATNNNGELRMSINGYTFLTRTNMNFATVSGKKWIKQLLFQTFRGGDNSSWYSPNDSYIYYDNVQFTKDPTTTF